MAPLTKDSHGVQDVTTSIAEVPNSPANPVPAQPQARPANQSQQSGQLRADAVSLEIPVKIHGSRAAGPTQQTEPFEEETSTMIVFPQGAVVRMATAVQAGQMLVVTNSRSRQDAICRVVKIRNFSNTQSYVEIEFTHALPNYWGTQPSNAAPGAAASKPATSPTTAPAATSKPVSAPPAVAPPKSKPEASATDVSWAPARSATPPSAPPVTPAPAKPAASVASVAQPPVQQAPPTPANSSAQIAASEAVKEPPKKSEAIDFPSAPETKPVPSLTMQELLGDEADAELARAAVTPTESHASESSAANNSRAVFGNFAASAALAGHHEGAAEAPALRIDLGLSDDSGAAPKEKNWLLIAAIIALAFAGAVAGFMYLRQHMGGSAATSNSARNSAPSGSTSNAASVASAPSASLPPAATQPAPAASAIVNRPAPVSVPTTSAPASAPSNSNVTRAAEPVHSAPVVPNPQGGAPASATDASQPSDSNSAEVAQKPAVTSEMVASTLSAHPITSQRADNGDAEAPTIDSAPAEGGAPSVSISSNLPALAVPDAAPEGPARVGGQIKEPKLVSYRQPIYPTVAKQTHAQGDVVVDTSIDKSGNVVAMKVVSGPTVLRQAALDALRQWKYQPSTLDGQPVAIQMLVTIKFRF
jgi:TonB family protein